MIIPSVAELRVQYDKPLDVMRVAWVGGQGMRQFRPAFTQMHEIAAQLQVSRVLLDINALPDVSVYDQIWLSASFMPPVLRLPLAQVVIVLSPQRVYNQLVVEGVLAAASWLIRFDVQFFAQAELGLAWLTEDSPRLPALLREWAASPDGASSAELAEPCVPYGQPTAG